MTSHSLRASGRQRLRPGPRRGRLAAPIAASGVLALLIGLCGAAPAVAADDASLAVTISQQTGTEPFQDNDEPGNDSGPSNDIVRTNDTVTYNLGVRYEGADQTAPTVRFTVPRGQELVSLPPFCVDGSSVTPESIPGPAVPLTGTSWESLPQQDVTCVLDGEAMGTSLNYPFITQVRSEVPHGTVMDEIIFEVSSDQVTEPVASEPLRQTVSAQARFDLSKQDAFSPGAGLCIGHGRDGEPCQQMSYGFTLTVPTGGKGASPLADGLSFVENIHPESYFGADVWARMVTAAGSEAAAKAAYAPVITSCGAVSGGFASGLPFSKVGNETNSVRNSGDVQCAAGTSAPGEPVTVTIEGADTSAHTVPTTTGTGAAIAADKAYVITGILVMTFPQRAVLEFGREVAEGDFRLDTHNAYENVTMTDLNGQPVIDDESNNSRDYQVIVRRNTGDISKGFVGIDGATGNTPASQFGAGEGPPGSSRYRDGSTQVMAGQAVMSRMSVGGNGVQGSGTQYSWSSVACDVWDADRLALAAHPDWVRERVASNGAPAFVLNPPAAVKNVKIEYSSGPAGPGVLADCSTGTWSEDPNDIVSPTTDEFGRTTWNGINRVRVSYTTEFPAGVGAGAGFNVAIGQVVRDSDDSSPIGNWASRVTADGVLTTGEVFANDAKRAILPTYDPDTHLGSSGDRLLIGEAIVRVDKKVQNPTTHEYIDGAVPQYTAGATVNYQLRPTLTAPIVVQGNTAQVVIEECLPRYQVFGSSTQGGQAIEPELIAMGAPEGSELDCAGDRQYVRWNLGEKPVGQVIEPIILGAEILSVARNGVYTNDVLVSSPSDASAASLRDDAVQMQLVVPTGIQIAKTVDKPLIEVNPEGVTNPRTVLWSVFFANIDAPVNVENVDVIDVLPADGVNGNDFSGELRLDSVTVAAGSGIATLYTSAPAGELRADPADASNGADGATVWCDAVGGGVVSGNGTSADCPQSNDEVTGLRFQRAGTFTPDDDFRIDIAMTPVGNAGGDQYRNLTEGRADGVSQSVGPAARVVDVIASSVGDYVWQDDDADGVQDDGEPGVAGVRVTLTGTDVDGNEVELSTVTDADGRYLFDGLASGTYRVTFDVSVVDPEVEFTLQHQGEDTALDSDADPETGQTQEFELGQNTEDLTLDAGVIVKSEVVEPVAPTLDLSQLCGEEATIVIPEVEGVVYEQSRDGASVTVTASVEDGYVFAEGAVTEWVLTIPKVEPCPPTEPTPTPTPEPTEEPTPTPTPTPTPEPTEEPTPTPTPTPEPTEEPTPTPTPTLTPTPEPTEEPTPTPTPTEQPTPEPTTEPTEEPSPEPTTEPSPEPTTEPSPEPTEEPSPEPTPAPSESPEPSEEPVPAPTPEPSETPAPAPGEDPTPETPPTPAGEPDASPAPQEGLNPTGGSAASALIGGAGIVLILGAVLIAAVIRRRRNAS